MKNFIFLSLIFSFQIFSHQLEYNQLTENQFRAVFEVSKENIQISGSELKKYEGVYRFGPGKDMKIYIKDSTLKALLPGQPEYTLLPSGDNVFRLKELQGYKMIFKLDENKKVISVTSSQPNGDFTAKKISNSVTPPKEEKTIILPMSKLKKFEGEYEFAPGKDMKVYIDNGNLKAYIKGQPQFTLLPVSAKEFILKNMSGYKMIFEENENGEVTDVISDQPNGKFKARKIK
ncbi:MAG: DUF3471 domain-containing protein [Ignavibacteriaceae bacterium]|jgi:hypothetical protein